MLLVISTLFAFALPVSAVESGEFSIRDNQIKGYETYSNVDSGGNTHVHTTQVSVSKTVHSKGLLSGYTEYSFPAAVSNTKKIEISLFLDEHFVITKGHEYNLKFSWGFSHNLPSSCRVYLHFMDTDFNSIKVQELILQEKNKAMEFYNIDLNFTPNIDFEQAYKCYLRFEFEQSGNAGPQSFYVSTILSLIDKDDNSGLINSIIEAIKEIPEKIKGFFVELGETILNGIKDLFIPDEEYLQNKKAELETFCVEHFGAVYQSIDVFIDFLNTLVNISPTEPKITFPAIDVPVLGQTYHLTDPVEYSFTWVNDGSHFLYYFYNFYRGFVTVLLFLSFVNYCRNKYSEIFGGDEE